MKRHILTLASAALACTLAVPAWGQAFPQHPIKIVQGFAAGGNADTIARLVGTEISKSLGQPVVVEAKAGAGGTIAATEVARAKPDGYTILLATGGHAVAGALYKSLQYKTIDDFDMVSTITYFPFLIVTKADSPYKTMGALLAAAKLANSPLTFGSAGVGTTQHLTGELLAKMGRVPLLHVPYRGDAAAVTALLSGDIAFIVAPPTAVLPNVQAGKLRALAATGPQRWSGMKNVPTVEEEGISGFDVQSWAGLMAPAGTPSTVITKLSEATRKAVQMPNVRKRLEAIGGEARGSTPQEMKNMVSAQLAKWTQVVADAKIPQN